MPELRTPEAAVAASATPSLMERVSWSSIFAGTVIALGVLTVLNLLGLAIGLYVIDAQDQNLAAGAASTTVGIWWALSALASLFVGGWIAGKLTGNPDQLVAGIHGAAVWAAATLLAVFTVSSAASAAFTGAAGMVGRAAQTATGATGAVVDALNPALNLAANTMVDELQQAGVAATPAQIRTEAGAVLNTAISPDERQQLVQLAQNAALNAATNPDLARAEYRNFIQQAFGANGVIGPEDRAQAISALSDRLGVPEAQIRAAVDNWQAQFAGGQNLEAQINALQRDAAQATAETADAVGDAAMYTVVGLILALLAAIGGSVQGRPRLAGAPHARVSSATR